MRINMNNKVLLLKPELWAYLHDKFISLLSTGSNDEIMLYSSHLCKCHH